MAKSGEKDDKKKYIHERENTIKSEHVTMIYGMSFVISYHLL